MLIAESSIWLGLATLEDGGMNECDVLELEMIIYGL